MFTLTPLLPFTNSLVHGPTKTNAINNPYHFLQTHVTPNPSKPTKVTQAPLISSLPNAALPMSLPTGNKALTGSEALQLNQTLASHKALSTSLGTSDSHAALHHPKKLNPNENPTSAGHSYPSPSNHNPTQQPHPNPPSELSTWSGSHNSTEPTGTPELTHKTPGTQEHITKQAIMDAITNMTFEDFVDLTSLQL